MPKVRLVAEFGSCHGGKLSRIIEAIDRCKAAGIDALKLQLFPDYLEYTGSGNVFLPVSTFRKAFDYGKSAGLNVSASAFNEVLFQELRSLDPSFIKMAYSKQNHDWVRQCVEAGIEPIISCDVMTENKVPAGATKLYCIPEYPVRYEVCFDEIFPRFDGFSDHTLGLRQTKWAIKAGAKLIEKHVRLGYEDELGCPDGQFSVLLEDFASIRPKS